ncbi:MAG: folate-binding protein [Alphaproteobacteria bacterium]
MAKFCHLDGRGVITLEGADRVEFLQGLVSNDVSRTDDGVAVWAAFLTPQGKFRHDMFIVPDGTRLLLDCEGGQRLMDLGTNLRRFVLRADVKMGIASDLSCFVVWGGGARAALGLGDDRTCAAFCGGIAYCDPRMAEMGVRILAPAEDARKALADAGLEEASVSVWHAHRIARGVPDGSRDMTPDKAILLENGFEELNGVDWQKGCYMGQELTARTKYRGLVKKRLMPVRLDGTAPEEGSRILSDGRDAGTLFSVEGTRGLALIRLDALRKKAPLETGGALIHPEKPDWMNLPAED